MKTACVLLADGFEEVEAITPIDYLRRAGAEVTVVGIAGTHVLSARGIKIEADAGPEGLGQSFDCVIVPGGGKGSANLAADTTVGDFILRHFAAGKIVAAICAAPLVVLGPLGILKGRRFTCFPGLENEVHEDGYCRDRVVVDGNLISSRAAGTAGEFSLALISALFDSAKAREIARAVVLED
jgi:4-methyl-5(b-hydroxyethyl)-thiazole monophosphate biosynthesis